MEKYAKIIVEVMEWAKSIIFALCVGAVIVLFARPSMVIGPSMEPTFHTKELVLVEKVSYMLHQPQRGDVIVAQTQLPLNWFSKKAVIKRVIGLPGDMIQISGGAVFINGEKQFESYIKDNYTPIEGEWVVPEHKIFVMGDNRNNSNDSRHDQIGYIDYSDIKGKVYLRVFPFDKIEGF